MTTFTFSTKCEDRMKQQHSMKKLAEYTGYSIASISRALDPKRAHMVKESTRKKIAQAVRELKFSVNVSARRLKIQRTEVISVAILRSEFRQSFSHEFSPLAVNADDIQLLEIAAKKYGYDLKLEFFSESYPLSAQFFDHNRTDGIIFLAYCGHDYDNILTASGLPTVFMSRYINTATEQRHFVGLNREPGFRQAVESLAAQQMKKIGWIGIPRSNMSVKDRILETLLREYELFNEARFYEVENYYQLREKIPFLAKLDAVFCGNDTIADWIAREFRYCKITPPLLIGYDNDPGFREQADFNSIGHSGNPMPELAVKMLDHLICNPEKRGKHIFKIVDCEYIERVNPQK